MKINDIKKETEILNRMRYLTNSTEFMEKSKKLMREIHDWIDGCGAVVNIPAQVADIITNKDMLAQFILRDYYIDQFGFSVPTPRFFKEVSQYGPLVEVGAGRGYLSSILLQGGVNCVATDIKPVNNSVKQMDGITAQKTYSNRNILCSWPGYESSWLNDVLDKMSSGQAILLIGEDEGGCTGNDRLFKILENNFNLVPDAGNGAIWSWEAINDRMRVWTKK